MANRLYLSLLLALGTSLAWSGCAYQSAPVAGAASFLIKNAIVVDGTGNPAVSYAVRVKGARIAAVGELSPQPGEDVFDARGLTLAPGFIDTHSHHDRGLFEAPLALAAISQGITTIIVGQDGDSNLPLGEYLARLRETPAAVNVGSYTGHGTLRKRAMSNGANRAAEPAEVAEMAALLRCDLEEGSLGLSSGLEYDPGIYSTTGELLALAEVLHAAGGRYISHIRSEDRKLWDAIDEAISIGKTAKIPVQISHLKIAMRSLWGQSDRLLSKLDDARRAGVDVSADVYPYSYWSATMTVLFPERDFENRASAEFALREIAVPEAIWITRYQPRTEYVGKTLAEVAKLRGEDSVSTILELIRESHELAERTGGSTESIIGTSMDEKDIRCFLAWPHANFCSDGDPNSLHPRAYGAFTRVLHEHVAKEHLFPLEEAIHKATLLSAKHVGIRKRGAISPGYFADLVLFSPDEVADRASIGNPHQLATGIDTVWVNGTKVFQDGRATGTRPGSVVRRE
jgi:N-acyl-D-amino-acid deacylase